MLQYLKNEANLTHTENGAVTYQSTQSECLDLFATIGAIRRESDEEITNRFLLSHACLCAVRIDAYQRTKRDTHYWVSLFFIGLTSSLS